MGSRELYSSIAKAKKKPTFWQGLGDVGKLMGDNALSAIGMQDVISNDSYNTEWAGKIADISNPLYGLAGQVGMAAFTGGAGNVATAALGKAVGPKKFGGGGKKSISKPIGIEYRKDLMTPAEYGKWSEKASGKVTPTASPIDYAIMGAAAGGTSLVSNAAKWFLSDPAAWATAGIGAPTLIASKRYDDLKAEENKTLNWEPPATPNSFASGGLRTFEGNTHEEGGIKLGADEVEGKETMFPMDNQTDFIFSDRILYPESKQSFATKSKRIESKYKLRPNDPYGKKSQDRELNRLAVEQETLKSTVKPVMGNKKGYGGEIFARGGTKYPNTFPALYNSPLSEEGYIDDIPFDTARIASRANSITSMPTLTMRGKGNYASNIGMTPKGYTPEQATLQPFNKENALNFKNRAIAENTTFQSNFLPTALGYAAQAASNLPAMFMKPDEAKFSRVKFQDTNLAESRNEARRSRNLGLATSRGIAAQSGDTGQAMNYLSGTTAAMNSQYGNLFNQSLMQEKEMNAQTNMREQLANSEIERYEEGINTAEKDSIRNLKMQGLINMGTSAAMAGKGYLDMQQGDEQIRAYGKANPYFSTNSLGEVYRKPETRFGGGGKRTKDPLAGVTISKGNSNPETGLTTTYDPTTHPLYPNYPDQTYYGGMLPPATVSAAKTPVGYRGDKLSRLEDVRTLPGYGVPNDRGQLSPTPAQWGQYPEKVRANMMSAATADRADYGELNDFAMTAATAGAPVPGGGALPTWAKLSIAGGGLGGGTALQYTDSEAAQNLGEYMQLIGGVEALPYLGKGLEALPYLAKGSMKLLKKVPPAVVKGAKVAGQFVKNNPRSLYVPALGAKYGYDSYMEKSTKKKSEIKSMYDTIPQDEVDSILQTIRKGGN